MCTSMLQKFRDRSFPSLSCYREMFCSRYRRWIYAHTSSVLLSSQALRAILSRRLLASVERNPWNLAQSQCTIFCFDIFQHMEHVCFLLVALLVICVHVPASAYAYVYVQACPDAIERMETPRNERTNERGKIVDSMGLMTPCLTKRLPSALSHDRNSFCQLNNLEA